MATSYTSLLGLALPVTGELAGTWGDVVNNSITSLLDTAVAGTTTLSTDADVTLTTTTGASNQARQAILLCSGARTALRTITAPAQSKIYAVVNNTTGGYAVKIVGVGPTTGVTVANGKTAVVVWNGADFVEVAPAVATNLSGGATGSVPYQSAASTTTFLSLGTAAQVLQVNAGATAPQWVSSTGTGNVVRATSPTLATPTITTSATVPLVIGGTGTTSTLTLRSTSGVGTTGADIVFQTGNNGATEVIRASNAGEVLLRGVSSTTGWPTGSVVISRINNATYAGIAIGDPSGVTANNSQLSLTAWVGGGANYFSSRITTLSNGDLTFSTQAAASSDASGTSTERVRIDASGNVGIGRTPTYQLDVNSTARFNSTIGVGNTAPAASGAGVSFPATQSASSDANTLDDYEEGSWTPTAGAGLSYTGGLTTRGKYTKIGNVVTLTGSLFATTLSCTAATVMCGSLPFTPNPPTAGYCSGTVVDQSANSLGNCAVLNSTNVYPGTTFTAVGSGVHFTITFQTT